MAKVYLFLCVLLVWQAEALGAEDPWDRCLSLDQQFTWNLGAAGVQSNYLSNTSSSGTFTSGAAAHFFWTEENILSPFLDYVTARVGPAYNLIGMEITIGDEMDADHFHNKQMYANDCGANGGKAPSMFPGHYIRVAPIRIPPRANGEPRGIESVHIKIWGHIH